MIGIMRHSFIANFVLILSLLSSVSLGADGLPGGCMSGIPQIDSRSLSGNYGELLIRQTALPCGGTCYTSADELKDGQTIFYHNVVQDNEVVGHFSYLHKNNNDIRIIFAGVAPAIRGKGLYQGLYGEMANTVDLSGDVRVTTAYTHTNAEIYEQNLTAVKLLHPEIHDDEAMSIAAARTPGGRQLAKRQLWPRAVGSNGEFDFTAEPLSPAAMKAHANLSLLSNKDVADLAKKPMTPCPVMQLTPKRNDCKTTRTPIVTTTPRSAPLQQPVSLWRSIVRSGGMNGMMSGQDAVMLANAIGGHGTPGNYNITRDPRSSSGVVTQPQRWPWHSASHDYRAYFLDNMGNKIFVERGSDGFYHAIN